MSCTVGDGTVVFALAAGIVGYLYVKHLDRQKKLEIIHQERMAAMEKGIPLPEFPLEPVQERRPDPTVLPILGTVLLTLSVPNDDRAVYYSRRRFTQLLDHSSAVQRSWV